MSPDHYFQNISRQIYHLLECSSVHLLLGCPDVALRHPLLDLCTAISATATYTPVAFHGFNVSTATYLVQDEYIRALCRSIGPLSDVIVTVVGGSLPTLP